MGLSFEPRKCLDILTTSCTEPEVAKPGGFRDPQTLHISVLCDLSYGRYFDHLKELRGKPGRGQQWPRLTEARRDEITIPRFGYLRVDDEEAEAVVIIKRVFEITRLRELRTWFIADFSPYHSTKTMKPPSLYEADSSLCVLRVSSFRGCFRGFG